MDAFLQEPRGKIGYVVKRAIQKSKVDRSNAIAKRCEQIESYTPYHKPHFRVLLKEGGADELR